MLCDRKSCTKAYHLPCLGLGKRPFGGSPARAAEARPPGAALGGRQGLGEGAGRSCLGARGPAPLGLSWEDGEGLGLGLDSALQRDDGLRRAQSGRVTSGGKPRGPHPETEAAKLEKETSDVFGCETETLWWHEMTQQGQQAAAERLTAGVPVSPDRTKSLCRRTPEGSGPPKHSARLHTRRRTAAGAAGPPVPLGHLGSEVGPARRPPPPGL